MDPEIWGNLPPDLLEHIAHFADIDSRRALGFLPRRLLINDHLKLTQGLTWWAMNRPFTEVNLNNNVAVIATEHGRIWWVFGMKNYVYERPS